MPDRPHCFRVGDPVRPRPEWREPHLWRGQPCGIPSGPVRLVVPGAALYVGDDHRAFAAYVFEPDEPPPPADER